MNLKIFPNRHHLSFNSWIENKISLSRTDYNKAVLNYKNKLEMFPSNFVGQMFNFKPELFFEIDKEEKENPKVKF